MTEITLTDLIKARLYFGHLKSKWYPKMKPYILEARNGIHIINLEKTLERLKKALEFAKELASKQKKILFVGTKDLAKEIVKQTAEKCQMPYINERWPGGVLTNFKIVQIQLKKLKELEEKKEKGFLERYPKKERLILFKKIENLNKKVGGLKDLENLPEAIFIIDPKEEKVALKEAKEKGVLIIALADTDVDPSGIEYLIPGNDRAVSSIKFISEKIAEAILEGKKSVIKNEK